MKPIFFIFKAIRKVYSETRLFFDDFFTRFHLRMNDVSFSHDLEVKGRPVIHVALGGRMSIGKGFRCNNGLGYNRIGREGPCQFIVSKHAELRIGKNVGMSHSTIVCKESVRIGDYVTLGGNVVIYDTDFHSLDSLDRMDPVLDSANAKCKAVRVEDEVFIGAHCTILKGVRIGKGAIIGAGSVVTKDIPEGEIWAGNPARFIRKVESRHIKVA